jgi:hypothetical protein
MALKCSHRQSKTVCHGPGGKYNVLAWLCAAENEEVDIQKLLPGMQSGIIQQRRQRT